MAGRIMKSLWEMVTSKTPTVTPGPNDLVPIAPQPGTPYVTQIAASKVSDFVAGGNLFQRATVQLTNAQILALNTTPVTIVPAVTGSYIVPMFMFLESDFSAGAYTNIGNGFCALGFINSAFGSATQPIENDPGAGPGITAISDFFGSVTRQVLPVTSPGYYDYATADLMTGQLQAEPWMVSYVRTDWKSLPMQLDLFNSTGDFTGGNAANRLLVTAVYTVIAGLP